MFGSTFAALTYIVPFLHEVTGISAGLVSVFLLVYGVAAAVGSFGGGRFADWNAGAHPGHGVRRRSGFIGCALPLRQQPVPRGATAAGPRRVLDGAGSVAAVPRRRLAGPGGQLAQSLPASAINLGIAFGSFAGGVALGAFTASAAVLTGLVIAVVAVPVALATSRLEPPTQQERK